MVGEHDPLPVGQGEGLPELLGGVLPVNLDKPALGLLLGPEETLAAPPVDLGRGTPPRVSVIDDLPECQNSANIR